MLKNLNDYKNNEFSQYGEDGIIKEILSILNITSGTCIEFGAWDGVLLSNTASLWTRGWKSILIEADKTKYEVLKKITSHYKNTLCINEFVAVSGDTALEKILLKNNINSDEVTLLSIDIDGNEYHILQNLQTLHPAVVITEYNQTIPPEVSIVSKENTFFGSSAKAIVDMMSTKGYILVAMTRTNCIFVDSVFKDAFTEYKTDLNELFDKSSITYVITGYDGSYVFSKEPSFGMTLPLQKNILTSSTDLYYFNHSPLRIRWNYIKDTIKKVGKKIIGSERISKSKIWKNYLIWLLKGSPIPAHGFFKWKVIKQSAKKHGIKTFIETGTAGGGTVRALEKYFDTLYTVELDPTLYHQGRSMSHDSSRIVFLEGDSGVVIKKVMDSLTTPALFWLDAHYSGIGTAKTDLETPIIAELTNIFNHSVKKHVIVIDDMREFNGTHDYPTFSSFTTFIEKNAPQYTWSTINDLMVIEPRDK